MTDSAENANPPKSTNSSVQIQINPKFRFEFVPQDTKESEFLDQADFGDVAFSVESTTQSLQLYVEYDVVQRVVWSHRVSNCTQTTIYRVSNITIHSVSNWTLRLSMHSTSAIYSVIIYGVSSYTYIESLQTFVTPSGQHTGVRTCASDQKPKSLLDTLNQRTLSRYIWVYVCTYVYTYIHIHIHLHLHIYSYIYSYIYIYI